MRKLMFAVFVSTALLGVSFAAHAQDRKVRYKYKKKELIDFEDVLIQGDLKKPQGTFLLNRKKSAFSAMIQERIDFKPELFKALDKI